MAGNEYNRKEELKFQKLQKLDTLLIKRELSVCEDGGESKFPMSSECEFVIYCMNAINQVSTFGLPYAIPHRVGYEIQTKNPDQVCCRVSENETSRSKEILSRLGIHCDWNRC